MDSGEICLSKWQAEHRLPDGPGVEVWVLLFLQTSTPGMSFNPMFPFFKKALI